MTDMQTIQQEGLTTTRNVSLAPRNREFFDDYDTSGFNNRSKYVFRFREEIFHSIDYLVLIFCHQKIMIDMMRIIESTYVYRSYLCMRFSNIL
jgi:hypothetical protein